jgi:hypothetical protein
MVTADAVDGGVAGNSAISRSRFMEMRRLIEELLDGRGAGRSHIQLISFEGKRSKNNGSYKRKCNT